MKRMIDIDTNDVKVTPYGTVSSGTMTYEAYKLGSMYIVYVKSSIKWKEGDNGWVFRIKEHMASGGTWISGNQLSSVTTGVVGGNPGSGFAILY